MLSFAMISRSVPVFIISAFILLCITTRKTTALSLDDYRLDTRPDVANEMYAGHMPLSLEKENDEGAFFFWLVKKNISTTSSGNEKTDRERKLVVWLNGGPGCTSLLGLIMENGPFTVLDDPNLPGQFSFLKNAYSWSNQADIVYVEQPIRTGFSLASQKARKIKKETQIAQDFTKFLFSFMSIFKEYQNTELYIAGESYAGFYVPWISQHILRKKHSKHEAERNEMKLVNIQGIAIGNGAIDYEIQEPSYAEYAYFHGLIPLKAKERMEDEWMLCMDSIQERNGHHHHYLTVGDFEKCNLMGKVLEASGNPNEYNVETYQSYSSLLFGNSTFMRFFNDFDIQTWLHVRGGSAESPIPGINFVVESDEGKFSEEVFVPVGWQACNDQIDKDMRHDHPTSSVPAIKYTSDHIRVLLYNGEYDLNCNFLGTQHTLERNLWGRDRNIPWSHAKRALWEVDGDVAGQHYQLGNVSFLIIKGAGHLVPMDKPKSSYDMLTRFLSKQSFADRDLPSDEQYGAVELPIEKMEAIRSMHQGGSIVMALLCIVLLLTVCSARYRKSDAPSSFASPSEHHLGRSYYQTERNGL